MKKWIKRILLFIVVLLLAVGIYAIYVFQSYHRLPDNLTLEVTRNGENSYFDDKVLLETRKPYWIMTYNVGFGAYRPEFSFFMDGGESSWGKDSESVTAAICGMGEIINMVNPEFVFLQEVDIDGTRSYHINELDLMNRFMKGYYYDFAQNYDSPFLMAPLWQPHGANQSGIATYSRIEMTEALRRSLPVADSVDKILDLDRCYSISRVPMENGANLCLYNVHLTAYGGSDEVREGQLSMLFEDMKQDYARGNYVICGGDFNHNLRKENAENAPEWAYLFPRENLPEGFRMAIDAAKDGDDIAHNSCRNADMPYVEGETFTVTLDGFIVSDNVKVNYYQNMDWRYEFSDHDPVLMEFMLD